MYAPYKTPYAGGGGRLAPPGPPLDSPGRATPGPSGPQRGYVSPYRPRPADSGSPFGAPGLSFGNVFGMPFLMAEFAAVYSESVFNRRFMPAPSGGLVNTGNLAGISSVGATPCPNPIFGCGAGIIRFTSSSHPPCNDAVGGGCAGMTQSFTTSTFWGRTSERTATRWRMSETGTVAAGTPNPTSWTWYHPLPGSPGVKPWTVPPTLDPMAQPINVAPPAPVPLPPSLRPFRPVSPNSPGDTVPPRPPAATRPPPWPRAPRYDEKENKKQTGPAVAAALLDALTESNDALNSLWWALPVGVRGSEHDRLADVLEHWDQIDWHKAAFNLAYNVGEDAIAGRVFGTLNKAFRSKGLSAVGWYMYAVR